MRCDQPQVLYLGHGVKSILQEKVGRSKPIQSFGEQVPPCQSGRGESARQSPSPLQLDEFAEVISTGLCRSHIFDDSETRDDLEHSFRDVAESADRHTLSRKFYSTYVMITLCFQGFF